MNLFCGPAADRVAAVQEHLQQADDAGVMEFDSLGAFPDHPRRQSCLPELPSLREPSGHPAAR